MDLSWILSSLNWSLLQVIALALGLALLRSWATFYWRLFPNWGRYLVRNIILKEFRLGFIPEFLMLFLIGLFSPYNFVLSEASLLALLYVLSGALTFKVGRINLPIT